MRLHAIFDLLQFYDLCCSNTFHDDFSPDPGCLNLITRFGFPGKCRDGESWSCTHPISGSYAMLYRVPHGASENGARLLDPMVA